MGPTSLHVRATFRSWLQKNEEVLGVLEDIFTPNRKRDFVFAHRRQFEEPPSSSSRVSVFKVETDAETTVSHTLMFLLHSKTDFNFSFAQVGKMELNSCIL